MWGGGRGTLSGVGGGGLPRVFWPPTGGLAHGQHPRFVVAEIWADWVVPEGAETTPNPLPHVAPPTPSGKKSHGGGQQHGGYFVSDKGTALWRPSCQTHSVQLIAMFHTHNCSA